MKKIVLLVAIFALITVSVFAQTYVVQEVTGRVERNAGGRWTAVTVGETLRADTVIRTVIGAGLTVRDGAEILTIGAMRNGALGDLLSDTSTTQLQGRVAHSDTAEIRRTVGSVSTASARASDAAERIEIIEEE